MSYNLLPYDQKQMLLMPPSLSDWVEEDSLAQFISDTVDMLDGQKRLEGFYEGLREDGWGRASYDPRMMVKVMLYGYCFGITSSRRMAQGLTNDIGMRYLSGNQQPDFRTISDFRKKHVERLQGLFIEILSLCRQAGLVKMGRVALDSRKVKGNASLDANRTREALAREVRKILQEAERIDEEEDRKYGPDKRGDELPEGLRTREERLERLRQAQRRLAEEDEKKRAAQRKKLAEREEEERRLGRKQRGKKPKTPEQVVKKNAKANTTDPDSKMMKVRHQWRQGYNSQAVADCHSQVIVAQDVSRETNDFLQLKPMLDCCEQQAGQKPKQMLADAGYWSESNAEAGGQETEMLIATIKDYKQRSKAYSEQQVSRGPIPKTMNARQRMERKLLTKKGRKAYKQRSSTIEPVFGQMVNRGLERFRLRGFAKVRGEWALWCATHNLLKLWRSNWLPVTG